MSAIATFWAWEMSELDEISASELLVLLKLSDNHNESTGRCDPSIAYIAKKTKLNEKTVRSALRAMHQKGILTIIQRPGRSMNFELNVGAKAQANLFKKSDLTPTKSGTPTPTKIGTPTKSGTPTPTNIGTPAKIGTPTKSGTPTPTNIGTPPLPILVPESKKNLKGNLKTPTGEKSPAVATGKKYKFSDDHIKTAEWMMSKIAERYPSQKIDLEQWADCIRMLVEIDKKSLSEICKLWRWILNHNVHGGGFSWALNCRTPIKLRQRKDGLPYFDLIWQQMTREETHGTQPAGGNTGRRESLAELAERETQTILAEREHRAQGQRALADDDGDAWPQMAQRTRAEN